MTMRATISFCRIGRLLSQSQTKSRLVSTLSPLGTAFNAKPRKTLSFKLTKENVGLFCIPELTNHSGFYELQEKVTDELNSLLREAVSPQRNRKMVEVFDDLSDSICRVVDMADFVRICHSNSSFRSAAEDTFIKIGGMVEKLNTNMELYGALKSVLTHGDVTSLTPIDQRVSELFLFDFEQSGIHLDSATREKFVRLSDRIMELGHYFMEGTQQQIALPKSSLPENLRYCFNLDGDNVCVTGLYDEHESDLVREAAYRIFLYPTHQQEKLLAQLLDARREQAQLVGFETYAHRVLCGSMAGNPGNVMQFLTSLADELKESAQQDYSRLLRMKIDRGSVVKKLMPWDVNFLTTQDRNRASNMTAEDLAPYLSLGYCMEGLSNLFRCLYGVTLQNVSVGQGEVWNYDIYKLAVVHETEGVLGYIYCDFFERSGKRVQDCHCTIQGGRQKADGSYQPPIVVLHLNLPTPQTSVPSLLSLGMVQHLFHEFGHAMHSMLGRTKYQHVTGTRCPIDISEVPSVLMEFFAMDPRVLNTFARHYKTGEKLPENIVENVCRTKKMFATLDIQSQVFYSLLDQIYHGAALPGLSTTQVLEHTQNKYYGIPYVPDMAWQLRFGHFVGYGAKYYSYLMCRAIATRIWVQYFKEDPFSRVNGERFRREMLAHGSEKAPDELIEGLLKETLTTDMMVDSLLKDLES